MAKTETSEHKSIHAKTKLIWPIWLAGSSIVLVLFLLVGMLAVVTANGVAAFWPSKLVEFQLEDGTKALGQIKKREPEKKNIQLKTGNRDLYGIDFKWFPESNIRERSFPDGVVLIERMEHGIFLGRIRAISGHQHPDEKTIAKELKRVHVLVDELHSREQRLSHISTEMERIKLKRLGVSNQQRQKALKLEAQELDKKHEFERLLGEVEQFRQEVRKDKILLVDINDREAEYAVADVVRIVYPNDMGLFGKIGYFISHVTELLTENPREANMEGGLFPAIFGTTFMVLLMSIFAVPFGVVAAVYLNYYAKEGFVVKLVRITINNLAGVPSIVFGIFGLGFFVYGLGSAIDALLFPERLPSPTFGTGGMLWASLTMALLTVPVVIVSTEEGLNSVPRAIKEGSLALGATKWQSLIRVILPMSMPSILTGFILAIARAAGEVAPLMLVGVVKSAHDLAVSSTFPYVNLERKFMHLGFHIYDIGFQSPNVEAALPMVFATTLLLLILVLGLSFLAMVLRNRMKQKLLGNTF